MEVRFEKWQDVEARRKSQKAVEQGFEPRMFSAEFCGGPESYRLSILQRPYTSDERAKMFAGLLPSSA